MVVDRGANQETVVVTAVGNNQFQFKGQFLRNHAHADVRYTYKVCLPLPVKAT